MPPTIPSVRSWCRSRLKAELTSLLRQCPLPPYFESMPILPPELVILILGHAATSPILDDPYQRFKWPWTEALRERAEFLCSASLVARSWTRPAQALLTSTLYVNGWRVKQLTLPGQQETIAVEQLCFTPSMRHFGPTDAVKEMLRGTRGVKLLCVAHNEDEETALLPYLALPNLRGERFSPDFRMGD